MIKTTITVLVSLFMMNSALAQESNCPKRQEYGGGSYHYVLGELSNSGPDKVRKCMLEDLQAQKDSAAVEEASAHETVLKLNKLIEEWSKP